MMVHTASHLCLMPSMPAAAPALGAGSGGCLPGGQGSGVKGHVSDRRIHTLIENSAARTELAGGRILLTNADFSICPDYCTTKTCEEPNDIHESGFWVDFHFK